MNIDLCVHVYNVSLDIANYSEIKLLNSNFVSFQLYV